MRNTRLQSVTQKKVTPIDVDIAREQSWEVVEIRFPGEQSLDSFRAALFLALQHLMEFPIWPQKERLTD